MATFDVTVYTSKEAHSNDGFDARDMAIEFIEGAFNRSDNHSVDATASDSIVDAPVEYANDPFKGPMPCHSYRTWYDDLLHWFREWLDCNEPSEIATDCNLLVTYGTTGGLGGGDDAYACVGEKLVQFDSYEEYGYETKHDSVDTLLEELGHALVSNMENEDDDKVAHDSGYIFHHSEGNTITPIGITGDTDYNNCNVYVNKDRWDGEGWEARYSQCTEDNFVKN
ncbi:MULTISPECIES: hypothetical protein [Halomicrobium]|uniref:Uncharacterized protein n=2 Tax=Halomicrobium mukohataei TaxID=57705 RepID=C7P174_HALMD|nr:MULTISPECIES: hypothetical protein [Halomicrobium]ACV47082.1 hypothetical protein Hmuk_0953 [Halomicrobium mukohataei DSM 12286]